jgi:preprotein translocase subunit YajC
MDALQGQLPFLLLMLVVFFFFYHIASTAQTEKRKELYEKSQKRRSYCF